MKAERRAALESLLAKMDSLIAGDFAAVPAPNIRQQHREYEAEKRRMS